MTGMTAVPDRGQIVAVALLRQNGRETTSRSMRPLATSLGAQTKMAKRAKSRKRSSNTRPVAARPLNSMWARLWSARCQRGVPQVSASPFSSTLALGRTND
jgi:hypothetical protein